MPESPSQAKTSSLLDANHNGLEYFFAKENIFRPTSQVIIKGHIPDLPIVTIAQDTVQSFLWANRTWKIVAQKKDRERWNDYGIGLLLQGDLKGAENAFRHARQRPSRAMPMVG